MVKSSLHRPHPEKLWESTTLVNLSDAIRYLCTLVSAKCDESRLFPATEVLLTDQVGLVELTYDPITGRQVQGG